MKNININVLVTGSNGMIGSGVVRGLLDKGYTVIGIDRSEKIIEDDRYKHCRIDLSDIKSVEDVFSKHAVTHVIHLAALAHNAGEADLSWERYYLINVECAKNIFNAATARQIPILFSSTADVYGITKGVVDVDYDCKPISTYAKTKYIAEGELKKICAEHKTPYMIMRFAPVYTEEIKRDIQKRYYLKYPKWAYLIGKGMEYEVLYIDNAINAMVKWISDCEKSQIRNVKNPERMNTKNIIAAEKAGGRAKHIIYLPKWMVVMGYKVIKLIAGSNSKFVYLINKAINPLRTE